MKKEKSEKGVKIYADIIYNCHKRFSFHFYTIFLRFHSPALELENVKEEKLINFSSLPFQK